MKLTITEVSNEEFKKIITEGDPVEPERGEGGEGGGNYHGRIMNLPVDTHNKGWYTHGHRDARHAAAEIGLEADRRVSSLEAQLADINTRLRAACIEQDADESVLTDPADWLIRYTRRLARGVKVEIARAHAEATARIEVIDNALDDASAPDATEAHALDNDPIIERIKLWKYAQDEMGDQLAESKRLWEVADQDRVASRKIAKDASRRAADLGSINGQLQGLICTAREQLNDLLVDEDLDDEKLRTASEGLLPSLVDSFDAALNPEARQEGIRTIGDMLLVAGVATAEDIAQTPAGMSIDEYRARQTALRQSEGGGE